MEAAFGYQTDFGNLIICEEDGSLTRVFRGDFPPESTQIAETPLLREAFSQLSEYFEGKRREFDLPLNLKGTPFQQRVWQAVREIPYGQTASYGLTAIAAGRPGAARAAGTAIGRNPLWIIVPCHRVIAQDGGLGGYAGGLAMKKRLLLLEKGAREPKPPEL